MAKDVSLLNPEGNTKFAEGFIISLITLNTAASLMNIGINSFLIYTIYKLRLFRKISYRFILCLSISDLCVGIIVQPMLSARFLVNDPEILPLLRISLQFVGIIFVQTSGVLTAVISLDRYLHMKHLMYYNSHMTKQRASLLITSTVVGNFLIGIAITAATVYGLIVYVTTCWLSLNVVILFTIVVLYTRAYLSIKRRIADTTFQSTSTAHNQKIQRPDLEFIKGMALILAALFAFYVPYEVTGLLVFFVPKTTTTQVRMNVQNAFYYSILCLYMMSCYNGIILIIFDRKLRAAFKRTILRRVSFKAAPTIRDTTICLEDIP